MSQTCFIWTPVWQWYAFMSTFFIVVLGCEGPTTYYGFLKTCLGVPTSPTAYGGTKERREVDSEKTSVSKDWAFQQLRNDSLLPISTGKKHPMKISSTVQFKEAYKSVLGSIHISVWGKFICLITKHRCWALALLITVRYMNGGGSPNSAGQKGGQSN